MRPRHTRRSDPELAGPTIQTAIRVPEVQRNAAQEAIEAGIPGLHSFTDVVIDALWLWLYESKKQWASQYGPVTIGDGGPVHKFVPPEMSPNDEIIGGDLIDLAEKPRPESNGRPAWSDVDPALLEDS